jgi:hypothetical protein
VPVLMPKTVQWRFPDPFFMSHFDRMGEQY